MRVRIVFLLKTKGGLFPFHHQYLLNELVKSILVYGGESKFKDNTDFSFSALKGQTKVSQNGLRYFSSRVTLVFSTFNKPLLDYFLASLMSRETIGLGELILQPSFVEMESERIYVEKMKYVCLAPIVLDEAKVDEKLLEVTLPSSARFSDSLYDSLMIRMEDSGLYTEEELDSFSSFQVVPDRDYLERMTVQEKKYYRHFPVFFEGDRHAVMGYTLPFALYAHPKVQEFVYTNGIGLFTERGFGMIDCASSNPKKETEEYKEYSYHEASPADNS